MRRHWSRTSIKWEHTADCIILLYGLIYSYIIASLGDWLNNNRWKVFKANLPTLPRSELKEMILLGGRPSNHVRMSCVIVTMTFGLKRVTWWCCRIVDMEKCPAFCCTPSASTSRDVVFPGCRSGIGIVVGISSVSSIATCLSLDWVCLLDVDVASSLKWPLSRWVSLDRCLLVKDWCCDERLLGLHTYRYNYSYAQ